MKLFQKKNSECENHIFLYKDAFYTNTPYTADIKRDNNYTRSHYYSLHFHHAW